MNYRLILYLLGVIAFFIGASMALSLPWAFPLFGGDWEFERAGFLGLTLSMLIAFSIGALFYFWGQGANRQLLRKESMAVVPLSWILAVLLGALPYLFSGTERGLSVPMTVADAIFESMSGFTTTGATVLGDLENPAAVPRSILFWRATTHFLGGLGIMVLFVVVLGQGITGKVIMKIEKGSGSGGNTIGKMRQMALALAGVYVGLIFFETVILRTLGLSCFDAICHSFSTMATGGFSNYNASIGHFAAETNLNAPAIELTIVVFMILAGSNFILLYLLVTGQGKKLLQDPEWRTYLGIILGATAIIFITGMFAHDFDSLGMTDEPITLATTLPWPTALRQSLFQVVSILTSTGFCTDQFEKWNSVTLMTILFLMFIGGCVGSTGGGTKIIRSLVVWKTVRQEVERIYRPNVVRTLKIGESTIDKETQYEMITFLLLFVFSVFALTFIVLLIEPSAHWTAMGLGEENRIFDVFSASLSTHSNIGPGFGVFGARGNYGSLTSITKLLFSWAMLLGRLELYLPLLLFSPSFWRRN